MNLLILALVISCLTPQGQKVTYARPVPVEDCRYLGLPHPGHWSWLGIEGDRLSWPKGQSLEVATVGGRVVRARSLLLLKPDENLQPQPTSKGFTLLPDSVNSNDVYGTRSRSTGKWNIVVFADFGEPLPADSVRSIAVLGGPQ